MVNVGDIFCLAADGEDVEVKDIGCVYSLHRDYGWDGVVAWVAKKRGAEPINPTAQYSLAMRGDWTWRLSR